MKDGHQLAASGQGLKAARVLPENLEKALNFPDKRRISSRLEVQEFKVTFPAVPLHSHTAHSHVSRKKNVKLAKAKETLMGNSTVSVRI